MTVYSRQSILTRDLWSRKGPLSPPFCYSMILQWRGKQWSGDEWRGVERRGVEVRSGVEWRDEEWR